MLKFILLSALAALVLSEDLASQPQYPENLPSTRIVGGEVAKPKSWPWQVSLLVKSGISYTHTCGGTLIKKRWVMTAAHCVDHTMPWLVILGEYNLNSFEGTEQIMTISNVYVHPNWTKDATAGYDIALLQLSTAATLNSAVQQAALPPPGQILANKSPCYATGWGYTSTGGPLSNSLKQALLPSVDYKTCSSPSWWDSTVKRSMICAGGASDSVCSGDSGGPLNCKMGGRFYVHGVTSFVSSAGCNTLHKPSVFTRVSAYIPWITRHTG